MPRGREPAQIGFERAGLRDPYENYSNQSGLCLGLLDEPDAETSEALERELRALGYVN